MARHSSSSSSSSCVAPREKRHVAAARVLLVRACVRAAAASARRNEAQQWSRRSARGCAPRSRCGHGDWCARARVINRQGLAFHDRIDPPSWRARPTSATLNALRPRAARSVPGRVHAAAAALAQAAHWKVPRQSTLYLFFFTVETNVARNQRSACLASDSCYRPSPTSFIRYARLWNRRATGASPARAESHL